MTPENHLPQALTTAIGNSLLHFALLLLAGSLLAALTLELFDQERDKLGFGLRSWKFTGSIWYCVLLFFISGAGLSYYPLRASLLTVDRTSISFLSGLAAVLMLLVYHFSSKLLKIRIIHVLPGLMALGLSLFVIYQDCLAEILAAWQNGSEGLKAGSDWYIWWLQQNGLFLALHRFIYGLAAAMLWFMLVNAGEKEGRRRQNREYYFKAAAWAGKWLLAVLLLALLPLARDLYLTAGGSFKNLLAPPLVYWTGATLFFYLLGFLLLLKITLDGLVNRRATLIITFFLVLALAASQLKDCVLFQ